MWFRQLHLRVSHYKSVLSLLLRKAQNGRLQGNKWLLFWTQDQPNTTVWVMKDEVWGGGHIVSKHSILLWLWSTHQPTLLTRIGPIFEQFSSKVALAPSDNTTASETVYEDVVETSLLPLCFQMLWDGDIAKFLDFYLLALKIQTGSIFSLPLLSRQPYVYKFTTDEEGL